MMQKSMKMWQIGKQILNLDYYWWQVNRNMIKVFIRWKICFKVFQIKMEVYSNLFTWKHEILNIILITFNENWKINKNKYWE